MEEAFDRDDVRGILHRPENPSGAVFALTHGAGTNCQAPLLASIARAFAGAGYLTLRYDLPFRKMGHPPMPAQAARDREGVAAAIAVLRKLSPGGRVLAGGHSYGGRQTAMAAAENPALADELLLFSYPLHPPAKPAQLRTTFFPELRTPARFVSGSKDPFGTVEEFREALRLIPARTELIVIEGSGHDLRGLKQPATLAGGW